MKTVNWSARSKHDTNVDATGFTSLIAAKKAVDAFCKKETEKLGFSAKIVADSGCGYPDRLNFFHFSTNCVNA